jgi:hypothetical protein
MRNNAAVTAGWRGWVHRHDLPLFFVLAFLVLISHATVDTAARFVLPPFAASSPQLVWWSLAGLWVVTAVVVAVRGRWSGAAVRDVRGDDRATARRADDVQGSA